MESITGQEFNMPVKFGFDAGSSNVEALKTSTGFILWTLIKQCHLADQFFDDLIADTAKRIIEVKPKNYFEFRSACSYHGLNSKFGVYSIEKTSMKTTNDVFWLGVWHYIQYPDKFEYEFDGVVRNLTRDGVMFANPQLFI